MRLLHNIEKKRASEALIDQIKRDTLLRQEQREVWGVWSWILFLILLSIVWFKRDALGLKGDTRSIVVRYEAPKGLSVLQAGLLYDKDLGRDDFYAALLELSDLGYVKIEEEDEGVVIQRIYATKGELSNDQCKLLDALFESGDVFSTNEASPSQYTTLFNRMNAIYRRLYIWAKEEGYTVDNLSTLRGRILKKIFLISLPLSIFSIVVAMNEHYVGEEISYILFSIFVALLPWFITSFFSTSFGVKSTALGIGVFGWYMLMAWELFPKQRGLDAVDVVGSYITVMTLLVVLAMVFVWNLGRYTQKGGDAVRELKGLEMFIRSVKEDEIRRRVEEEPDYMEKLFPYAILFGQAKHWLEMYDILKIPLSKRKYHTLWNSLERSNILRSPINSSHSRSFNLSGSTNSSSGSSSFGGAGGGGGGSW